MTVRSASILSICAASLVVALAPAAAQETTVTGLRTGDLPTEFVRYSDLDLTSSSDQTRLATRVRKAAYRICGQFSPLDLPIAKQAYECHGVALNGARPQMDSAIAAARNGTQVAALSAVIRVSAAN